MEITTFAINTKTLTIAGSYHDRELVALAAVNGFLAKYDKLATATQRQAPTSNENCRRHGVAPTTPVSAACWKLLRPKDFAPVSELLNFTSFVSVAHEEPFSRPGPPKPALWLTLRPFEQP